MDEIKIASIIAIIFIFLYIEYSGNNTVVNKNTPYKNLPYKNLTYKDSTYKDSTYNNGNNILNYLTIAGIIILGTIILKSLLNKMEEYKLQDDPKLKEIKDKISPMFSKDIKYSGILEPLNSRDIMNEIELYKGDKSYTINKRKIFLCLFDENGNYYPDMMYIFVLLHELSHCICDEVGHTPKFNKIFDAILEKAAELNIYDPSFPIILDYCMYKKD